MFALINTFNFLLKIILVSNFQYSPSEAEAFLG
jgi:hypothetical protein